MPGNPREIVTTAERRFPVRIRISVPSSGFGQHYTEITEWLDGNCGADGWAITPSGMRGVLNDAVIDLFHRRHAGERVRRPIVRGNRIKTDGGVYRLRDDEPAPRIGAGLHRTP